MQNYLLTQLDSGTRVITEPLQGVRSAAIGLWIGTGSRDEDEARAGVTHFLEHLLFKGSEAYSAQEIAEIFDTFGGELNAATARDYTVVYGRVLDDHVERALDVMTDMVFVPTLADLDSEREVVLEEIAMIEDSPQELVHDLITQAVFGNHPLGRPVLGTADTIRAATRDKVHRFYRRHYVPGRLVVAAAGNLRHEDLIRMLRSRMDTGRVVGTGDPQGWDLRASETAPESSARPLVKRRKTEQAHICLGTNGLPRSDPDRFPFLIVNGALGTGMSSRLFQEIREKRGLAYSVYSYHSQYTEAGLFSCYAGTTPARAAEVIGLLRRELEEVAGGGLTAEEFSRAKGHVKGSMVLSLEDPGSRMSRIGKSEIAHGEILTVSQALKRVEDVTLDDAQRVAKRVLSQPMTLTVLGPFAKRDLAGVME